MEAALQIAVKNNGHFGFAAFDGAKLNPQDLAGFKAAAFDPNAGAYGIATFKLGEESFEIGCDMDDLTLFCFKSVSNLSEKKPNTVNLNEDGIVEVSHQVAAGNDIVVFTNSYLDKPFAVSLKEAVEGLYDTGVKFTKLVKDELVPENKNYGEMLGWFVTAENKAAQALGKTPKFKAIN